MAIYYVKNGGSDGLSGTSEANAWATINKVNISSFTAGDSILFERGGIWNEVLTPPSSGSVGNLITFGAYGTGANPLIHGYKELTGWTLDSGDVYYKNDAGFLSEMRVVTIDGVVKAKGRYPKADAVDSATVKNGFLVTSAVTGNTVVTTADSGFLAQGSFNGGEVVIIKVSWIMDQGAISAHTGGSGSVTYTGTSATAPGVGFGFFVQNHQNCLTEFGDWRYDSGAKRIYMNFAGSTPASHSIKASYVPTLLNVNAKNYVKYENITFSHAHTNSVLLHNSTNNIIDSCEILKSGIYGIEHTDSSGFFSDNCTINNNLLEDIFDTSVHGHNMTGTIVTNNLINRNYQIPGTGKNDSTNHIGIGLGMNSYRCGSYTVSNNTLTNIGFMGIYPVGSNNVVSKNIIDGFCQTLEDGGGIYTYYFEQQIDGVDHNNNLWDRNIIRNGIPNGNPNPYGATREVYGLYFDASARGVTVSNNVIENCYAGIYLNKAKVISLQDNKIIGITLCGILLNGTASTPVEQVMSGLDIQNNQIHSLGGECLRINNYQSSISAFGTINNNYYINPSGGVLVRKLISGGSQVTYTTIAAWTAAFSYDALTNESPTASAIAAIFVNETASTANVEIGTLRKDVDGVALSTPQSLVSFGSIMVLEGEDPSPPPSGGFEIQSIGVYTGNVTATDEITISGASVGNLLVVICHIYAEATTPSTPAGWTLASNTGRNYVFTRVKQSGDSATTVFNRVGGDNFNFMYLVGFALGGTTGSITFGTAGSSNYAGNMTIPSVTHPNSNPAKAFAFAGSRYGTTGGHTYSGSWVRQQDYEKISGQTGELSWAMLDLPTGGATGTVVVTNDSDMQGQIFTINIVTQKPVKTKVADVFGSAVAPKIKVGGVFTATQRKIKVGGVFV